MANRPRHQHYSDRPEWHAYQRFLPLSMRYTAATLPTEEWWEWRDADVHIDRLPLADAPLKVLLLHGGGGNGRVLMPLGQMVHRLGYEYLAPDLPGYGLTRYGRNSRPDYGEWSRLASDLVDAEIDADGRPVVVFGLSVGGFLAYMTAARNARVAGVIATTLLDLRRPEARDAVARNRFLSRLGIPLGRAFRALLDPISLPMALVSKMDRITNDPDFSRVFLRDPLAAGSRLQFRFMRSLFEAEPAVEPEEFSACPLLLAHPALDMWTPPALSREVFDRLACPKRYVELEGAGHFPYEQPGATQLEEAVGAFLGELATPTDVRSPARSSL
ncbi:MAG: alpha/beta fold hydrolase [Spirochaetia bacterium]